MFYDEDMAYAQRLRADGVDCETIIVPGAFHGFDAFSLDLPIVQNFRKSQMAALKKHLAFQTIGPDKVNQLRHVRLLQDKAAVAEHMAAHAALIRPRFETVLDTLERELAGSGMGSWMAPRGGYFISFDTVPGLAQQVIALAQEIGVKLTPAGATFPYGEDPRDQNIRLAPTYPSLADAKAAAEAFVTCVKLASIQQRLQS